MTICLISSITFYQQLIDIKNQLTEANLDVSVPPLALKMELANNFDLNAHMDYYGGQITWEKKGQVMKDNFDRLLLSDHVLVINLPKHDRPGYIGGNVLMEMALAFQAGLPISLWSEPDKDSSYYSEIMGMQPSILNEDLQSFLSQVA